MRVQAFSTMQNREISTSLAADALKSMIKDSDKEVTIDKIQKDVASYYHVTVDDLKGKRRVKAIVTPRQIAMYLARELTGASLPKIGAEFGGKDHTTVLHAHEKITKVLEEDAKMKREIEEIKDRL